MPGLAFRGLSFLVGSAGESINQSWKESNYKESSVFMRVWGRYWVAGRYVSSKKLTTDANRRHEIQADDYFDQSFQTRPFTLENSDTFAVTSVMLWRNA